MSFFYPLRIICFFKGVYCAFAICLLIPLVACAGRPLKGHKVFQPNEFLHFNHRCSEANRHSSLHLSSLAFFEKDQKERGYKALAWVRVEAGYVNFVLNQLGFNLRLHQLKMESLDWINQKFSLHLRLVNLKTNEVIDGQTATEFFYFSKITQKPREHTEFYQTSNTGSYDHLNVIEEGRKTPPSETLKKQRKNLPSGVAIYRDQISRPEDPHAFFLVLTNLKTKAQIALTGPRVHTLIHKMDGIEERTDGKVVRVVGFFETFNPLSDRSLFGAMRSQVRYDKCFRIQSVAKQQFAERFKSQRL